MALKTGHWSDHIWTETEKEEYQTCTIRVADFSKVVVRTDPITGVKTTTGEVVEIYTGQARFIPVRASVFEGGEGQANAMSIRSGRIQIPRSEIAIRVNSATTVLFVKAPKNPSLLTRSARVTEDFQGATSATRTFHVYLDADGTVA